MNARTAKAREILEKDLNEYGISIYYSKDIFYFCHCYATPENYSDKQFKNAVHDFMLLIGVTGSYCGPSAAFPDLLLFSCSMS